MLLVAKFTKCTQYKSKFKDVYFTQNVSLHQIGYIFFFFANYVNAFILSKRKKDKWIFE